MPRQRERGRSRTRRGVSRSWSPPNPRLNTDLSPDSRDVVHYARRGRATDRRAPPPPRRPSRKKIRSPSPLTNGSTMGGTTVPESDTEANDSTSDDETTKDRRRKKKKKNVNFKNKRHQNGHIASKIESAAVDHAKELNELAKRLSLCALVLSSSDESDSSSSDESKSKRKKRSKQSKSNQKKKKKPAPSSSEDESSDGSTEIVSRPKRGGRKAAAQQPGGKRRQVPNGGRTSDPRARARVPMRSREGRQDHHPGRVQRGYEERRQGRQLQGRRGYAQSNRRAMASPRCFDDNTLSCSSSGGVSTNGQSIYGRNLGRYGRRVEARRKPAKNRSAPNPDAPIIKQLRLPPGPLGINVTSSGRGPTVAGVSGHCNIRGLQDGDVLTELDGRDITGLSAPEVIAIFRATRSRNRVVTIRRTRRSAIM